MAVWIHKEVDGEIVSELIDPAGLESAMSSGWVVNKDSLLCKAEEAEEAEEVEFTLDELRAMAKEEGVEGWETMRTKKLKAALGMTDG